MEGELLIIGVRPSILIIGLGFCGEVFVPAAAGAELLEDDVAVGNGGNPVAM